MDPGPCFVYVRPLATESKKPQATQTLFVIYIRDSIALRFEPCMKMVQKSLEIHLVVKDLNKRILP